jgi:competence protein ComEC
MMAGFWLSFGAVVLILLAVDGRIARTNGWRALVKIQASITLGLMPLLFIFFGEASILAPLVNLLLVPWFAIALVPLSLIGLPLLPITGLAEGSYAIAAFLMSHTLDLLAWVSDGSLTTVQLAHLPTGVWLCAMLGALVLLAPLGIPGRGLGVILILPVVLIEPERAEEGEVWFTLLDVGQGLACVVETSEHLLLYDTGPAYASGFSTAEAAILPYLSARNWPQVDLLVVSNGDSDHAGGVETLLGAVPVSQVVSGEELDSGNARRCQAGERWSWDGVEFSFLHPQSGYSNAKSNNHSCVLKVTVGEWSLLLPGDIEGQAERQLIASQAEHLKSHIVVAPHHGSKTSSSAAFIQATEADWVLFSAGYRNRYGFPKSEVVDRWRSHGATPISSSESGAIQFRLKKGSQIVEPVAFRKENLRYWHH